MQILFDYFRFNPWYKPFGADDVTRFVDFQKKVNISDVNIWDGQKTRQKKVYMYFQRLLQKLNLKKNWIQQYHKHVWRT